MVVSDRKCGKYDGNVVGKYIEREVVSQEKAAGVIATDRRCMQRRIIRNDRIKTVKLTTDIDKKNKQTSQIANI